MRFAFLHRLPIATMLLMGAALNVNSQTSSLRIEKGIASYYGKRATGRLTSSGERLHHDSLTCAHKKHPFGTLLRVTNPANDSVVVVKVNDRGPFGRGRIVDLSWCAARQLGILRQGIAPVVVEVIYDPRKDGPKAKVKESSDTLPSSVP